MAITPLPAAPSRAVPSTFSTLADAFVAALPTFVTEANALQTDVNAKQVTASAAAVAAAASAVTADSYSDLAQAAANFKGAWSALTGAAAIPYSVSHLGRYWMLITATSNIAADVPGTSAKWQEIGNVPLQDYYATVREPDQGVAMTYAASGSSGITVADNDNIDFGTGNFTLVWKGSLPDWTPSGGVTLFTHVNVAGYYLNVAATGVLNIWTNTVGDTPSTIATGLVDGTVAEIVASVANGTGVSYYVNGVKLGDTVSVGTYTNASESVSFHILGNSALRYASTVHHIYTFNRALTAAEVLDLYRNGISESDKWGSQTNINSTTWASSSGYDYDTFESASAAGFHAADVAPTADKRAYILAIPVVAGKKYRASWTPTLTSGTDPGFVIKQDNMTGTAYASTNLLTASVEFTATLSENISMFFLSNAAVDFTVAGFTFVEIGATLCLLPENAQPSPGQWIDASTNLLHAMQPATGSSLTRPKDTFTVKWTNTWAGTHEAQYIGGVNQSVLPPNCYVQSIIGVIAGSTIEDVIVGDGSDTDHWVAITTGLAAGTVSFTVANAISDGTNYKLVADPDANFTGSITWTIKGIVL